MDQLHTLLPFGPAEPRPNLTPEEWAAMDREIEEEFAMQDYCKKIEREYYDHELPRVRKSIAEWAEEFPLVDRREMRRRYLQQEVETRKEVFRKTGKGERELKRAVMEARVHLGQIEGVTGDKIARAREHPITEFIEHRGFMAKCPFHKDRSPSMNLKNNFFYCHGCGETGDVIDFVMRTRNMRFKEAVELLAGY